MDELSSALDDQEYTVVTNIWGTDVPEDLRDLSRDMLIDMHDRISRAVQLSFDDDDKDSLGILLPLETKIAWVLYSRL